jgi:hypothetical protein
VNPPSEQLIRDYLNRVSVAARARLSPDERRAFLARTRELIEQNTRGAGQIGPMGVAQVLNKLGDPAALVARECDRLAAQQPGTRPAPGADQADRAAADRASRRPRPARGTWTRGTWKSRLRPSGDALTGRLLPPAAPAERAAAGPDHGTADGAAPRRVLAGDVVTGHVPTADEPVPGPPPDPVPGPPPPPGSPPPAGPAPWAASREPAPPEAEAAQTASDAPLPADVRPAPRRRTGWPWQAMGGASRAGTAASNGRGPGTAHPAAAAGRPGRGETLPGASSAGPPDAGREPARDEAGAPDPGSAPDPGTAPEAASAGSAPVIGRWDGGHLVTGDVTGDAAAGAQPRPPSSGRTAANGQAPPGGSSQPGGPGAPADQAPAGGQALGSGVVASDFIAGDFTDSDVPSPPGAGRPPAGPDQAGEAPAGDRDPARGSTGSGAAGPGTEPGDAPATPVPAPRAGLGAAASWLRGARERAGGEVSSWAGWKPARGGLPWPSLPPGARAAIGGRAKMIGRYLLARARQQPLEAVAVVLVGLGGAVYPPVWLLGAVAAMASRTWGIRDKWLGLALPLFVVIVGMGADVSLGGARHGLGAYVREAWIFGGHLSRIVAVLGAIYLAWRSQQPPRRASPEPWKKQRRFN